jgi:hypothetical protein
MRSSGHILLSLLKAYKLSIVQGVTQCIVRTPLSVNVLVTHATQLHLEYHCKTLFKTPCINNELIINSNNE